jgi:hypothetical protein
LTDDDLRVQLLQAPEVDLEAAPGTVQHIISRSSKLAGTGVDYLPGYAAQRADLVGLPLHQGAMARIGREEALNLKVLSQRLRLQIQSAMPGNLGTIVDPRPDANVLRQRLLGTPQRELWLRPQAIGTLRQLLMPEHRNVRLILVELLSQIEGPLASMVLAERAIFDLDPEVRVTALVALKSRPVHEYDAALVRGLRYPWPTFADHAAEALVALDLRDAVPKMIPLLDARDLSDPYVTYLGKSRWCMMPELVRINHLRNCLLCHSYSASPLDPIRGLVPNAEHLVPLPATGVRTGWGGGEGQSGVSIVKQAFVRPDINFVRQDFSVIQPVPKHGKLWPPDQRFDYLIRLRPVSGKQLLAWQDRVKSYRPTEPQRETLLFALRALAGENPGPAPEDWKRLYSTITGQRFSKPLEPPEQLVHLRDCLLQGSALQQADALNAFKDKRGSAYDTALALALPQMRPELQKSARTILVDRLFCLPLPQLREKLGDQNLEVRRAAVTVCKQRKLKPLVPELILLLDDDDAKLAQQVHDLLQQFASRNLGPRPGADHEQRQEAMAAWRDWWEKESEKQVARKRSPS